MTPFIPYENDSYVKQVLDHRDIVNRVLGVVDGMIGKFLRGVGADKVIVPKWHRSSASSGTVAVCIDSDIQTGTESLIVQLSLNGVQLKTQLKITWPSTGWGAADWIYNESEKMSSQIIDKVLELKNVEDRNLFSLPRFRELLDELDNHPEILMDWLTMKGLKQRAAMYKIKGDEDENV